MKLNKLIALLLAFAMLFAFVGCPTGNEEIPETPAEDVTPGTPDNPENPNPENPDTPADPENPDNPENPPAEEIPADSIRNWTSEAAATEYKVYNVEDLKFLAETVSAGNTLAGITVVVANDITINESVLKAGFLEPEEGEGATANASLVNLASIGMRGKGFAGTFDGNGKVIKGLYMYQANQGLGFIGATAEGAVIKNVTIIDACVVNCNASGADDGSDDDRFGGLVGLVEGATTIENCVFIGVVGSEAAKARGGAYEYIGGLIGRCDAAVSAKDCTVLARVYGGDVINQKGADKITKENVIGIDAANTPVAYEGDNEYVKAAVDAINAPAAEPENPDTPVEPENPDTPAEPENPDTPVEPENPDTPTEPENPDTPVEPENPDTPVEPENPDTPVEPENPDTPVEPENPDTPVEPENPDTPAEPENPDTPADPEPENPPVDEPDTPAEAIKALQVTANYKNENRYQFIIDGFEVKNGDALTVVMTYPEASVSEPLLRSVASSSYPKFKPTTATPVTDLLVELTATATEDTAGLMITLNGTFGADVMPIYILGLAVNDTEIPLESITSPVGDTYEAGLEIVEVAAE